MRRFGAVTDGALAHDHARCTPPARSLDNTLTGTTADDTITGFAGNDIIRGLDGADLVDAGPGNDSVKGDAGNDTLDGGTEGDIINGGDGEDSIIGGEGADTITGGLGNDTILAGDGNDTIDFTVTDDPNADAGDDSIDGGDGADLLRDFEGDNTVSGGLGNDTIDATGSSIDGGEGNDQIGYRLFANGLDLTVTGGAGDDNIFNNQIINDATVALLIDGGDGDDNILGSFRTVQEGETLLGGAGDDTVNASSGDDLVDGGTGNDILAGDNCNDTVNGGDGDDTLQGNQGDDTIDGGANDTTQPDGTGDVVRYFGNRSEYSLVATQTGINVVNLGNSRNEGSDLVVNVEIIRFLDIDVAVNTELTGQNIVGTPNDDNGEPGAEPALTGTIANDTIAGLEGDDLLIGLNGIDILNGDEGDDTLDGGAQDDALDGGDGTNVAQFSGNSADYTVTGNSFTGTATVTDNNNADGDDGTDTLSNIRILRFQDEDIVFNNAPQLGADAVTTDENVTVDVPPATLLANDSDPDGDQFTVTAVSNAQNGSAQLFGTFVRFVPAPDFFGTASFDYTVSDGFTTSTQTVTVTVTEAGDTNLSPTGAADVYTVDEDNTLTVSAGNGVLANDSDADGTVASATLASGVSNGSLMFNADGSFTYTPDAGLLRSRQLNLPRRRR